ncbi:MAG: hypothetical protein ACFFC7_11845 [Candidatus Hermodarchaeota archaeon]
MAEDRQTLFNHWQKIPLCEYIDVPKDKFYSHPVRSEILNLLREGFEEESPDGKFKVRHALNVIEMRDLLVKRKNITMSSTTLYFHLDILQELGLIKIVATLQKGPHGRNKVKYYGRIARNLFISSGAEGVSIYTERFDEFRKLADILGIPLPDNYSIIPQKLLETRRQFYKVLGNWLANHEELIAKENLNMGKLYDFLKMINEINPKYINLLNEVFSQLKQEISEL